MKKVINPESFLFASNTESKNIKWVLKMFNSFFSHIFNIENIIFLIQNFIETSKWLHNYTWSYDINFISWYIIGGSVQKQLCIFFFKKKNACIIVTFQLFYCFILYSFQKWFNICLCVVWNLTIFTYRKLQLTPES